MTVSASTSAAIAAVSMGNPFSISSEFVIDDFSGTASAGGSTVDLALVARASSADFNTAPAYRLVYTLRNPTSGAGVLTILETGAGAGITAGAGIYPKLGPPR